MKTSVLIFTTGLVFSSWITIASAQQEEQKFDPADPFRGLYPPPAISKESPAPMPFPIDPVPPGHTMGPSFGVQELQPPTKEELRDLRREMRHGLLQQPICPMQAPETDEERLARDDRRRRGEEPYPRIQTFQEYQKSLNGQAPCMDLEMRDARLRQLDKLDEEDAQ
jgi:hypothetical protein